MNKYDDCTKCSRLDEVECTDCLELDIYIHPTKFIPALAIKVAPASVAPTLEVKQVTIEDIKALFPSEAEFRRWYYDMRDNTAADTEGDKN